MFLLLWPTFFMHVAVQAYPRYQDQIPNGHVVPNPCHENTFWAGVGHENYLGGGVSNPFGLYFAANGHVSHLEISVIE